MRRPVHILLPVHNRCEITRACVAQLSAQTYDPIDLVVIDDGSTDATTKMLAQNAPTATVLDGDGNLWWAGCLQRGLEHLATSGAQAEDVVVFLNDDTMFDPYFIENGVKAIENSPDLMLLAQAYSLQTGRFIEVGARVDWSKLSFDSVTSIDQANCLSTRGLFMRFGNAVAVGGFRPRLLPHYLSDYEFTIRALKRGLSVTTDSSVRLLLNEATTGEGVPDKRSVTSYVRSVMTNRSPLNPIHWSWFVILACPRKYVLRNLYRIWSDFARNVLRAHARHAASL